MQLQLLQQHAGKQPKEVPTIHILLSNHRSQRTISWLLNCHSSLKWLHNWADYRFSAFRLRVIVLFSFRFFWVLLTGCHVFLNTATGVPRMGAGKRRLGRTFRVTFANAPLSWDLARGGEVLPVKFYLGAHLIFFFPAPRAWVLVMAFAFRKRIPYAKS